MAVKKKGNHTKVKDPKEGSKKDKMEDMKMSKEAMMQKMMKMGRGM